jgi:hypothetical protein
MKTEAVSTVLTTLRPKYVDSSYRRAHRKWVFYMLTTTITAAITGIFGLTLAGASLLRIIDSRSELGYTGTILLAVTFPLLVLAAHCLDRIEDVNRSHRVASYKRIVFGEEMDARSDGGLAK